MVKKILAMLKMILALLFLFFVASRKSLAQANTEFTIFENAVMASSIFYNAQDVRIDNLQGGRIKITFIIKVKWNIIKKKADSLNNLTKYYSRFFIDLAFHEKQDSLNFYEVDYFFSENKTDSGFLVRHDYRGNVWSFSRTMFERSEIFSYATTLVTDPMKLLKDESIEYSFWASNAINTVAAFEEHLYGYLQCIYFYVLNDERRKYGEIYVNFKYQKNGKQFVFREKEETSSGLFDSERIKQGIQYLKKY